MKHYISRCVVSEMANIMSSYNLLDNLCGQWVIVNPYWKTYCRIREYSEDGRRIINEMEKFSCE